MNPYSNSPKKRTAEEGLSRSPSPDTESSDSSSSSQSIGSDEHGEPAPAPVGEPAPAPVGEPAPAPVGEPAPAPVGEPAPHPRLHETVFEPEYTVVVDYDDEPLPQLVPVTVSEPAPEPKPESSSPPHRNPRSKSPKSLHGGSSSSSDSCIHSGSQWAESRVKKLGSKAEVSLLLDLLHPETMEEYRDGLSQPFDELARKFPMYQNFFEEYRWIEEICHTQSWRILKYKQRRVGGEYAAVKVYEDVDVQRDAASGGKMLEKILTDLWISLSHDSASLIKCRGWFYSLELKALFLIMDPEENLMMRRRRFTRKKMDERQVVQFLFGIILGLRELHASGFVHTDIIEQNCFIVEDPRTRERDLAAGFLSTIQGLFQSFVNEGRRIFARKRAVVPKDPVFLYPNTKCLLGGYECCRFISDDELLDDQDTRSERPQDKAFEEFPEFSKENERAGRSYKADVWSIGILAHELLTGQHPFFGWDRLEQPNEDAQMRSALERIKMRALRSPGYKELSNHAKTFLTMCFQAERERYTVDQLLDTSFIYHHVKPDLQRWILRRNDPSL